MSNAAPATSAEPLPLDDLQGSTDLAHEKGRWTLWVIGKGGTKAGLPPPLPSSGISPSTNSRKDFRPLPRSESAPPALQAAATVRGHLGQHGLSRGEGNPERRGRDDLEHLLKHSSTHWLRHTTIGATVEATQDLQLAQQLGWHSSVLIVPRYGIDADGRYINRRLDGRRGETHGSRCNGDRSVSNCNDCAPGGGRHGQTKQGRDDHAPGVDGHDTHDDEAPD